MTRTSRPGSPITWLRTETAGGTLLLTGAVIALAWANSPWRGGYTAMRDVVAGPAALGLDLSLAHWASDGLLAIFFFVVGLELKQEFVTGELRHLSTAAVPVVAAVGGMAVPAAVYAVINANAAAGDLAGWAVPTATDIAFAVGVLTIAGRHLPPLLRAFLLTLAVVDDLLAIVVIALFYNDATRLGPLAGALAVVAVFALAMRRGAATPWLLVPLALAAWFLMHASGIHATIAGVLLGLVVPAVARPGSPSPAQRLAHRWGPVSAGLAVPVFALFAAGVPLDVSMLSDAVADPVAQGVALGLVLGKPIGIVVTTWAMTRATRTRLAPGVRWVDMAGVGIVAGIGFTVSLLIGELAFGEGTARDDHVRAAILAASLVAAVVGAAVLAVRSRHHHRHR